jgi:hypothetical protein
MRKKTNYYYNIIDSSGIHKPWTGKFKSKISASNWFEKHGSFFQELGYELVLKAKEIIV